ncbi:MAG TPA: hypothetical protein PK325_05260 [Cyclobacteriaceae bacterium]|nr:hypothetical protein [Cyclobacteriaceae bacterium]HMV08022.1 hypothetical protein [Cyclobacteriaceae bacterium]HMV91053.1 hypothetical protein [Cyclobacteriaceae bacterium]HMX00662.1 hypothetical protein [Cyclobacteriaceae bacterium]HMX49463.1 hypothetical protein [Cyclobacteriaceae bacterium]
METGFDSIKRLVNELKTLTFWDRIFKWGTVRATLVDASADLQRMINGYESQSQLRHELELEKNRNKTIQESLEELKFLRTEKESLMKDKVSLESRNDNYLKRGTELSNEVSALRQKIESYENELKSLRNENTYLKSSDEQRLKEYESRMSNLTETIKRFDRDRIQEKEDRHAREIERLRLMKQTWINHEDNVKSRIKLICNRHGVEYADQVPFKGKPDNTLKINDEYIIFDAKSPANDDLSNFPLYLKAQTEQASKYIKEENVRKEIFLVVPVNTLEAIKNFEYRLSDYNVYVISVDALEPIIIALQKIEAYEFADKLSPEDRDNICRVIGKFVHLSKRRIQIDGFFAKQFFELLYRKDAELPAEFLEKATEFERNEVLNPPSDRRTKQISNRDLQQEVNKIKSDAEQKGIYTEETHLSKGLNRLPLYTDDSSPDSQEQKELF